MSQSEEGDNSFMAMLNNPIINPGPAATTTNTLKKTENTRLKPCTFPSVQTAEKKLTNATKDVYLSSESDESFQVINTSFDKDTLPTTVKELVQLGLIDDEEQGQLRIKSLQEFLNDEQYEEIVKAFKDIESKGDESKVYLLGEESVTVLILCIIKDKQGTAIVGLKSLLVQT